MDPKLRRMVSRAARPKATGSEGWILLVAQREHVLRWLVGWAGRCPWHPWAVALVMILGAHCLSPKDVIFGITLSLIFLGDCVFLKVI